MEKKKELLNVESAPEIFAYMNELDGLSRSLIERVSKFAFIPLDGHENLMKPSQVFIRSDSISSAKFQQDLPISSENDDDNEIVEIKNRRCRRKRTIQITNSMNKKTKTIPSSSIILDDTDKSGLIDYVDYGSKGNSFLLSIGVLHHPSATILAELLLDRQAIYFSNLHRNHSDDIPRKLCAYTSCLRQLALAANTTSELQSVSLVKRLKNEAWCLGYQFVERSSNNENQRIFKIVPPNEIYLDDDHQCAIDLRPLLPPDELELTKLYEKFGARWLSECVQRTLAHKGEIFFSFL